MSEADRGRLGISSPIDLKNYIARSIRNPGINLKSAMDARLSTVPEEQREMLRQHFESQLKLLEEQKKILKEKLERTKMSITGTEEEGERASVTVKTEVDGISKSEDIQLEKIEGKWYFLSSNFKQFVEPVVAQ